jgi:hypothetical protein
MLDLTTTYPGRVITTDPDYPQGKARNRVNPGDGTGTPWEEQLANDIIGWKQALVDETGITPSGVPDRVGASDILDGLVALIAARVSTGSYSTFAKTPVNISGASPDVLNYIRVGNWVAVFGQLSYTNTGSGAKSIVMELNTATPSSNFAAGSQVVGFFEEFSGGTVTPGDVVAQLATKEVVVRWNTSSSSGNRTGRFFFIYSAA